MELSYQAYETYSFDHMQIAERLKEFIAYLAEMGVDPADRGQLKQGYEKLFSIEYHNLPDLDRNSYILAPNHVSDFDALILGLLHPKIKIMSKKDWVDNANLQVFLHHHYDLVGIDRESKASQARALVELIRHLNVPGQGYHALIFPQGTISDINYNSVERIQSGVFALSHKSSKPVVPVFLEQPSFHAPTRIVFGEPMGIPERKQDCRGIWQKAVRSLQNLLDPPARNPVLTEKHANNNHPGDPFF